MTEEQKTQIIKELSRKSVDNGGFVLRRDVLLALGICEDEVNASTDFDDLVNELSEAGIDCHEDETQAIASDEESVDSMTEEELEEENLEYPDMEDEEVIDEEVPDFDIPEEEGEDSSASGD